ncbi:MAG: glycosyltransferase family 4 protein [Gammaproteobacteria bacterium]
MAKRQDKHAQSARPIRLVHLQLLSMISGVQKVTLDEFQSLDRTVFEPTLICKEEGALTRALDKLGLAVHFAPGLVRPISVSQDFLAARQLFALLRRLSPDIVHTHSSKTGILGRITGRLSGVPVVIHMVHGYAFPFTTSRLVKLLYFVMEYVGGKLADVIVVLNESDRRIAVDKLRIPARKVLLIPNGIDVKAYRRSVGIERDVIRREQLGVTNPDAVCIGMVGRLWEQKNAAALLRAARLVIERSDQPVQFFLIGDGKERADLEQYLADHGLTERIQIMGWRQDVPDLLSALDMFVLPSLWEGMPLAILEAMASSLPVIASNISGNSDLITHGVDGLLFESGNDEQFATQMISLMDSGAEREKMGSKGRQKVIERYQVHSRVERMSDLYQALLADKRPEAIPLVDKG